MESTADAAVARSLAKQQHQDAHRNTNTPDYPPYDDTPTVESQVSRLRYIVNAQARRIEELEQGLDWQKSRITGLEERVADMIRELFQRVCAIENDAPPVESQVYSLRYALAAQAALIARLERRIDALEAAEARREIAGEIAERVHLNDADAPF